MDASDDDLDDATGAVIDAPLDFSEILCSQCGIVHVVPLSQANAFARSRTSCFCGFIRAGGCVFAWRIRRELCSICQVESALGFLSTLVV